MVTSDIFLSFLHCNRKAFLRTNTGIILKVHGTFKDKLGCRFQRCRDARLRSHYLIVIGILNGQSVAHMAAILQIHRSTVYRIAASLRLHGELGLFDRREDNGCLKLDEAYLRCFGLGRNEAATQLRLAVALDTRFVGQNYGTPDWRIIVRCFHAGIARRISHDLAATHVACFSCRPRPSQGYNLLHARDNSAWALACGFRSPA
jgi:hypothetical protein